MLDAASVTLGDGTKAYELRDLDVFEFLFVAVGANRDTIVVAVKSITRGNARIARAKLALLVLCRPVGLRGRDLATPLTHPEPVDRGRPARRARGQLPPP